METDTEMLRKIAELAARMRKQQRHYFETRTRCALRCAKEMELALDGALEKYFDGPDVFDQLERSE